MATVYDAQILGLPKIEDPIGNLSIIEQLKQIPFEINNFCKKEKLIINGWIEETIWNHSDRFTGPEE